MALNNGDQGDAVKDLQRQLMNLGLYLGKIDGDFGGGTEKAVSAFQEREGFAPDFDPDIGILLQ